MKVTLNKENTRRVTAGRKLLTTDEIRELQRSSGRRVDSEMTPSQMVNESLDRYFAVLAESFPMWPMAMWIDICVPRYTIQGNPIGGLELYSRWIMDNSEYPSRMDMLVEHLGDAEYRVSQAEFDIRAIDWSEDSKENRWTMAGLWQVRTPVADACVREVRERYDRITEFYGEVCLVSLRTALAWVSERPRNGVFVDDAPERDWIIDDLRTQRIGDDVVLSYMTISYDEFGLRGVGKGRACPFLEGGGYLVNLDLQMDWSKGVGFGDFGPKKRTIEVMKDAISRALEVKLGGILTGPLKVVCHG